MKIPPLSGHDLKTQLLKYLENGFQLEETLFQGIISHETYYQRADPLRHPIIFYYGHTAVFYINKMIVAGLIQKRINPEYESIFAVGVDEMSWDDLQESHYNWPSITAVQDYRKKVYNQIKEVLLHANIPSQITWDDPLWGLVMGMEHQRIHIETGSVLIRQLPLEKLQLPDGWKIAPRGLNQLENQLIKISGGDLTLGRNHNESFYGWDNEYGEEHLSVNDFHVTQYLTTNQEYLKFVKNNGYQQQKYWCDEGWQWVTGLKRKTPFFWIKNGDRYRLRTVFQEIDLPPNWPAEVNYLEAKAFCRFKSEEIGKTCYLPTEAQWTYLSEKADLTGNLNFKYCSPCDVDCFQQGEIYDLGGNVWEWTETPLYPLSGFKIHPFYDDFTLPTFDDQHHLIKGGSWISTGNETLPRSRYAFRKHFQQHAGFRYVIGEKPDELGRNYIFEHNAVEIISEQFSQPPGGRSGYDIITLEISWMISGGDAAVIGAGPGGLGYRLTNHFDQVTALEWSARLLTYGVHLKKNGHLRLKLPHQGELEQYLTIEIERLGVKPERLSFHQSDPENLKEIFSGYHLIVLQDALVRMVDPEQFLKKIDERLNEDGYLVIISDYNFHKNQSLYSRRIDGEPVESLDMIRSILKNRFQEQNIFQQLIYTPKNSRSFNAQLKEISIWQLKPGYGIKRIHDTTNLMPSGFSSPF